MLPIASHSRWISSPPLRRIAPATPAPKTKSLLAALTMASVSISVRSPCWMTIFSASDFIVESIHISPVQLCLFLRGFLLPVVINAASRLAAPPSFLRVLPQQGIGTVLFAQRLMEILENSQPHIKPDEIDQLERSHGMIQPQLQRFVDIFGRRNPRFKHVERFVADQRVHARGDKSGRFVHDHYFLAHAPRHFAAGGHGFLGRLRRSYDFDELHFWHGIEEVHPDAAIARNRDVGK